MSVPLYYLTPETQAALMAEAAKRRAALALKRTNRFVERRVAKTDRRLISDRRAMQDTLNEAFAQSQDRRFSGEPLPMFGAM